MWASTIAFLELCSALARLADVLAEPSRERPGERALAVELPRR